MKLPKLFLKDKARAETGHSIKKVSIVRTPTSVTKMISRKYKFHVIKRKIADLFEPSEILFGQIQF